MQVVASRGVIQQRRMRVEGTGHHEPLSGRAGFLACSAQCARPQEASTSELRPVDPYKISVSVSSVVLHATVENHKGAPVSGLGKDDFQVYEDGALQQLEYFSHEDIPVTVGLVLDNSGSMGPKRTEVIAAALAFARSSNPQDQMFVVNFNEHVTFGLPADMPFTDQTAQLQAALSKFKTQRRDGALRRPGGGDRAPEDG